LTGCRGVGYAAQIAVQHGGTGIGHLLEHIGVDSEPTHNSLARGPPLWDGCDAQIGHCRGVMPRTVHAGHRKALY